MVKGRNKKSKKSLLNKGKILPGNKSSHSSQTAEQQAASHLQSHRYKNAMDGFKRLLKQVPDNEQFQLSFMQASQGRCLQLAEKKMFKEACVIWENLQRFVEQHSLEQTEQSPHLGDYLHWLLKSKGIAKALDIFLHYEPAIKKTPWFSELQSHFAAHLLLAPEQVLNTMDAQQPMRSHCYEAKRALNAFCDQQFDVMQAALKNIPFRSAFKDFVLILKSQDATETSAGLLKKVSQSSAFYPFSQLLMSLTLDNEMLLQKLRDSKPQATALLAEYLGWDKEVLKAWNNIKQLLLKPNRSKPKRFNQEPDKKVLLKWLLNAKVFRNDHSKEAMIKSICRLLLLQAPSEYQAYIRRFGDVEIAEKYRIQAILAEKNNKIHAALDEWDDFLMETESSLVMALVYRKMADLAEKIPSDDFYYEIEEEYTPEYNLQQSLLYDSEDKDSYLRLLAIYEQDKNNYQKNTTEKNKARQQVINDALNYFPNDRTLLIAAIKESQQRKVFKKAASLANRLLKVDPTNLFARQMLVDSHLAHARKNIISAKYHLVKKEITLASKIAPDSARVVLFQGILSFLQKESPERYSSLIDKAFELFSNPLLGMLILNTELEIAKLNREVGNRLTPQINREQKISSDQSFKQLNELFEQLQQYQNEGLHESLNAFLKSEQLFKHFSKNIDDQEHRIKISSLLIRFKIYPLAKWFIKFDRQLLKKPLMQYYQAIADSQDCPEKVTDSQLKRLKEAYAEANEAGDKSVANRLSNLLAEIEKSRFLLPANFPEQIFSPMFDDDDDDDDMAPFDSPIQGDLFAMMEEMLGNLSEAEKENLMRDMEQAMLGGQKK